MNTPLPESTQTPLLDRFYSAVNSASPSPRSTPLPQSATKPAPRSSSPHRHQVQLNIENTKTTRSADTNQQNTIPIQLQLKKLRSETLENTRRFESRLLDLMRQNETLSVDLETCESERMKYKSDVGFLFNREKETALKFRDLQKVTQEVTARNNGDRMKVFMKLIRC